VSDQPIVTTEPSSSVDRPPVLGFVGFGEVGHAFTQGLREQTPQLRVLAYDAVPADSPGGRLVRERAAAVGARVVDSVAELVAACDIVLCAVPAAYAMDVATAVVDQLRPGQAYFDLTASHPETKRQVAALLSDACEGLEVMDLAIVGPVLLQRHRVPIMASGSAGPALAQLCALGMQLEVLSPEPGEASATKLCRSVFTKGFEALLVETALMARSFGIEDRVLASIEGTLATQTFTAAANRYITQNAVHAARRVHEIEDVARLMTSVGIRPLVTNGSLERMRASAASGAREHFGAQVPADYRDVVDFYAQHESPPSDDDQPSPNR
jgi:3-hydroxyisobutyrate dehydrogenase-like beta-hydroxyacid dehydrogenase